MDLKIGDIVEHSVLRKKKVIVGIEGDRYLCVERRSVALDGKVRPNSRVSIHSGGNFYVIGHISNVQEIKPESLFEKKKKIKEIKPSNFKEIILTVAIVSSVSVIILIILISVVINACRNTQNILVNKAQEIKEQLKGEIKNEAIKQMRKF